MKRTKKSIKKIIEKDSNERAQKECMYHELIDRLIAGKIIEDTSITFEVRNKVINEETGLKELEVVCIVSER